MSNKDMYLYVYDTNLTLLYIIDEYTSLIWTDRYMECGDFEMVLMYKKEYLKKLKEGYFVRTNYSDHWAIIEKLEIKKDDEEAPELTVEGRSIESILDRRVVIENEEFGVVENEEVEKVSIQDSIETLLNHSFIEPEDSFRQISNFIMKKSEDKAITDLKFSESYNGEDILKIVSDICDEQKIGFKITIDDEMRFVFELYKGKDRSLNQKENDFVVFSSSYDNLLSSTYSTSAEKYRNIMVVNKTETTFLTVSSSENVMPSGIQRREISVNIDDLAKNSKKNLNDKKAIEKARKQLKTEYGIATVFDAEIIPNNIFVYKKDYDTGDIVQLMDDYGNRKALRIIEVIITFDENGLSITPGFEDPEDDEKE